MATMPMGMTEEMPAQDESTEKCFAIWVAADGTASVAEIPPEQAAQLVEQVETMPAKSQSEAMQMLSEMMPAVPEENPDEQAMRGYEKGARPEKASLQKIFGE